MISSNHWALSDFCRSMIQSCRCQILQKHNNIIPYIVKVVAVINFYHQKLPPMMITKELMMKVFLPNALDEIALLIWKRKRCNTVFFTKTYWTMCAIIFYEGLMPLKRLNFFNFFAPKTSFNSKTNFQKICLRNCVTFIELLFVTVGFNHNLYSLSYFVIVFTV